ncbi:MAG: hypothetical protein ACRC46_13330 [Thermoguttaceae bacterium]
MWDWMRWVGDQVWNSVAAVIRTIEGFWNFMREFFAFLFIFLEELAKQYYGYLTSVLKFINELYQRLVDVLWAMDDEGWSRFCDWFIDIFMGDDGIITWFFGLACDGFEFLIDKVPDIVLPESSAAAFKVIVGYVSLLNEALPVFEGFAILLVLLALWTLITLIRIVIKLIPTIG